MEFVMSVSGKVSKLKKFGGRKNTHSGFERFLNVTMCI